MGWSEVLYFVCGLGVGLAFGSMGFYLTRRSGRGISQARGWAKSAAVVMGGAYGLFGMGISWFILWKFLPPYLDQVAGRSTYYAPAAADVAAPVSAPLLGAYTALKPAEQVPPPATFAGQSQATPQPATTSAYRIDPVEDFGWLCPREPAASRSPE